MQLSENHEAHDSLLCWLSDGKHNPKLLFQHTDGTNEPCTCKCHERGAA